MANSFPASRQAGVCLHITALPGEFGCGDLGGARNFIDTLADMDMRVWQFLPIGPTGYGDSPYQSLSTFAGNELLIDVAELAEQGLLGERELNELRGLPADQVDFAALAPARNRLLDLAAERYQALLAQSGSAAFEAFIHIHNNSWLADYALFRALKRRHGEASWTAWPPEYRDRNSDAVAAFKNSAKDELMRIKVRQFFFHKQWSGLRYHAGKKDVLLFGDTPIYLALDSADVWSEPRLVRLDRNNRPVEVGGVPPDSFSADGQLWGNPLYDWDHQLATNFAWWCKRLRFAFELVELVRIDHFRGLEAFWAVPFGAKTARSGSWRKCPGHELLDAVFAQLDNPALVAEDLGFMTDQVRALRDGFNIPGMIFLQEMFREGCFDVAGVDANSVCYPATHDSDTVLGWLRGLYAGRAGGDGRELGRLRKSLPKTTGDTPEAVAEAFIHLAMTSGSNLVILQLQDLLGLGSEARFNRPGTLGGNWRWRLTREQLGADTVARAKKLVEESGRQRRTA